MIASVNGRQPDNAREDLVLALGQKRVDEFRHIIFGGHIRILGVYHGQRYTLAHMFPYGTLSRELIKRLEYSAMELKFFVIFGDPDGKRGYFNVAHLCLWLRAGKVSG